MANNNKAADRALAKTYSAHSMRESAMSNVKPVTKPTRKPNNRANMPRGQARVSARRIGGANYRQEMEAERYQRALKAAGLKETSANNSGIMNVTPINMNPASVTVRNLGPAVEELGAPAVSNLGSNVNRQLSGKIGSRKSSSRMMVGSMNGKPLGSQRISIARTRRASSLSNTSGTLTQAPAFSGMPGAPEVIIRYGELLKKTVVGNQWNKRFFILTDKHIYYYDESFDVPQEFQQIDMAPKAQIDLALLTEIKKDKNDPTGATFNLFTPARVYRLRMEAQAAEIPVQGNDDENMTINFAKIGADQWVTTIAGACENLKQHAGGPLSRTRNSFGSFKVDEIDTANSKAQAYKHPAKRLIDSETFTPFTGNAPHKPAQLEEYEEWTPFDVAAWLYTVQLSQYSESFYKQQIDGKMLSKFTKKEDALNVGVQEQDVMKFLECVNELITISMAGNELEMV